MRKYEKAWACALFRHKALLFSWPGGLHVGESQLWCHCLFSSGAIGCTTFCFQWEGRQECASAGTWTSLVLHRSCRGTKWHEATMLMKTVFNEQHCGLLLWWLVGRLELYINLWVVSVMPNWDAGHKGKHGQLQNPNCWMYHAADCGGIETGFEWKTDTWPSLTSFRH